MQRIINLVREPQPIIFVSLSAERSKQQPVFGFVNQLHALHFVSVVAQVVQPCSISRDDEIRRFGFDIRVISGDLTAHLFEALDGCFGGGAPGIALRIGRWQLFAILESHSKRGKACAC